MEVEEVRSILSGVASQRVVGLVSADGVCSPLSFLCSAPSYFGGRSEAFELLCQEEEEAFRCEFGEGAFHLEGVELRELLSVFWGESVDGRLDSRGFGRGAEAIAKGQKEEGRVRGVLERVWRAFGGGKQKKVDASSVLAGLSVLTSGDSNLRLSESFGLFDANGDGVVTLDEMVRYVHAVLTVYRERAPRLDAWRLGSVEGLAKATAEACFATADANRDGVVTFDEFRAWHERHARLPSRAECAKALGLEPCDPRLLYAAVVDVGDAATFAAKCAEGLVATPGKEDHVATRLWTVLGGDPKKLLVGLATIAGCDRTETLAAFLDSGPATKEALAAFFWCVFAVLCDAIGGDPEKVAIATADRCFRETATTDAAVAYDAFKDWAERDRSRLARAATCLDAFTLEELSGFVRPNTRLDAPAFRNLLLATRRAFAARKGLEAAPLEPDAEALVRDLFDALRRDDDDAACAADHALLGLSVLCRPDNRAKAAYDLLQIDGIVPEGRLLAFLDAVYRVVAALHAAPPAPDLAHLAARNALSRAAKPDSLTRDEFFHFLMTADLAPTKLQAAVRRSGLADLDASRAMNALQAQADSNGYLDKNAFVNSLRHLLPDNKASNHALADVFDAIRHKTAIHVAQRVPAACIRKLSS
ncbi:hypothetical protein CTAYLR_000737 [Chrysophaeum taylorii]|uniref:EF-hand domain-containing protein n=1 Tax=Chrysophaeum taylorii TaxID=2483200 RepID=A0AAD7U8K9_9STRA|nr:hypothetical protein CTAYLR_000737 [Chrysophaeum taylorii]